MFDEARAYVSNLNSSEVEHWYVWKEDWPDWRAVAEVEGITEMIFRVLHVSPPPPPRDTHTHEQLAKISSIAPEGLDKSVFAKNEISQTGSLKVGTGEFILRNQKRYNKRLRVIVIGEHNQEFKTFTRDVSVGGMYVEHSLPEWVAGYFKVRIAKLSGKQVIELTCCLIENQLPEARFRLAILPLKSTEDEKNFETWLAA